jgi:hypothetical protein
MQINLSENLSDTIPDMKVGINKLYDFVIGKSITKSISSSKNMEKVNK